MIPKIIHYCWLSGDDYPERVKHNIDSWEKFLPDYEFILWDKASADKLEVVWINQAIEKKKFAFAADYIRLFALYNYGGIYLDSDVEVLKSFDNLLNRPYFFGVQHDNLVEAAILGAEKKSDWLLYCMSYYEERAFVMEDGRLDMTVLPKVIQEQLKNKLELRILNALEAANAPLPNGNQNFMMVYPFDYFSAKNYETGEISITDNTYTIHHFNSSWLPVFSQLRRRTIRMIGLQNTERLISFLGLRSFINRIREIRYK